MPEGLYSAQAEPTPRTHHRSEKGITSELRAELKTFSDTQNI
jgi:hypothetical protein